MSDDQDSNLYYASCDVCRAKKYKFEGVPHGINPKVSFCARAITFFQPDINLCLLLDILTSWPSSSNLTAAENRVKDLEAAISALLPGVDIDEFLASSRRGTNANSNRQAPPSSGIAASSPVIKNENEVNEGPEALPRNADGFDWAESKFTVNDLSDGMAALAIDPQGAGYLGPTSSVVPLRALLNNDRETSPVSQSLHGWMGQSSLSPQLPQSLSFLNVSENTFVDAYFRYYHSSYPFIHEPTFHAQFQNTPASSENHSWFMLRNTVLAIGAWCIGDESSVIDNYFYQKVARLSEEASVFEKGNMAMVQALLLLSNYAQKCDRPNTGWNYLGLAVRMAISIGLHKEFPNWEISLLQREMRRRLWWGVFIFDSGASITFGRPVLLPENGLMDASHVLNIHEESLTPNTTILCDELEAPTVYTCLILQSRFHLATNSVHHRLISHPEPSAQERLDLEKVIDTWAESIPHYFRLDFPAIHSNDALLFAYYRLSWRSWNLKIILLRPVLLSWAVRHRMFYASNDQFTPQELECRRNCIQSAHATITSVAEFMDKCAGSRLSTWYLLYFLFQAGLIPIICLMTDPNNEDAPSWLSDMTTANDLLSRTAINNTLARRCLDVFDRLYSTVAENSPSYNPFEDPDLFNGALSAYSYDQSNTLEFWDWSNSVLQWPS